jgi:hypothetical protein
MWHIDVNWPLRRCRMSSEEVDYTGMDDEHEK